MNYDLLLEKAAAAGIAAGEAACPVPMIVVGGGKEFHVPDGPCGFARVKFPANGAFGRWAKAKGKARKDYPSGLAISVHAFGQSLARKEAYAYAFANVLSDAGVPNVYAVSNID